MFKAGEYWLPDTENHIVEQYRKGGWQLDHLTDALEFVKKFDVAVDGGAHVGSWTKALSEKFTHVHSFDLNPDNFECLLKNVSDWNLHNATMYHLGLGDKEETVGMSPDERWGEGNTGGMHINGDGNLKVTTLDITLSGLTSLDFLKLDIEGYEEKALKGGADLIEKFNPVIQIEHKTRINERNGGDPIGDLKYLESIGYKKQAEFGCDWVFTRD